MAVAMGAHWDKLLLVVAAVPQRRRVVQFQNVVVRVALIAARCASVFVLVKDAFALGGGGLPAFVFTRAMITAFV